MGRQLAGRARAAAASGGGRRQGLLGLRPRSSRSRGGGVASVRARTTAAPAAAGRRGGEGCGDCVREACWETSG
eukprot:7916107-Alexandrium_andersonii.AAC.1